MKRPRWTAKMILFKKRSNYQQKTIWYTQFWDRSFPLVGWILKTRKVLDTNQPVIGTYYQNITQDKVCSSWKTLHLLSACYKS